MTLVEQWQWSDSSSNPWYESVKVVGPTIQITDSISNGEILNMNNVGSLLSVTADVVGALVDPIAFLASSAARVLIDHCGPIQKLLDGLVGSPGSVAAEAKTWGNIRDRFADVADTYAAQAKQALNGWSGPAAWGYEQASGALAEFLRLMGEICIRISDCFSMASGVVAAARAIVRDLVSDFVGQMISLFIQAVATLGLGLSWAMPIGIGKTVKTTSECTTFLQKVLRVIRMFCNKVKDLNGMLNPISKTMKGSGDSLSAALKALPSIAAKSAAGSAFNVHRLVGDFNRYSNQSQAATSGAH